MKKITLAIIILISIIVFCGITNAINDGIDLAKVNAMYEDIETLEDKIALYYLDYGYIPVKEKRNFNNSINPNDNDVYYEIDLNKLDNIYLNYTQKEDCYVINEESHTIYYLSGIDYKNEKIYTKNVNYTLVDLK